MGPVPTRHRDVPRTVILRRCINILGYLASEWDEGDNAGEMSPGSSTDSYPAFAHIGLRENPRTNLNQTGIFWSRRGVARIQREGRRRKRNSSFGRAVARYGARGKKTMVTARSGAEQGEKSTVAGRNNISKWCQFFEESRVILTDEAHSGRLTRTKQQISITWMLGVYSSRSDDKGGAPRGGLTCRMFHSRISVSMKPLPVVHFADEIVKTVFLARRAPFSSLLVFQPRAGTKRYIICQFPYDAKLNAHVCHRARIRSSSTLCTTQQKVRIVVLHPFDLMSTNNDVNSMCTQLKEHIRGALKYTTEYEEMASLLCFHGYQKRAKTAQLVGETGIRRRQMDDSTCAKGFNIESSFVTGKREHILERTVYYDRKATMTVYAALVLCGGRLNFISRRPFTFNSLNVIGFDITVSSSVFLSLVVATFLVLTTVPEHLQRELCHEVELENFDDGGKTKFEAMTRLEQEYGNEIDNEANMIILMGDIEREDDVSDLGKDYFADEIEKDNGNDEDDKNNNNKRYFYYNVNDNYRDHDDDNTKFSSEHYNEIMHYSGKLQHLMIHSEMRTSERYYNKKPNATNEFFRVIMAAAVYAAVKETMWVRSQPREWMFAFIVVVETYLV
ncbi:hypothetical protein ANN_20001 [Periplaneta americana]|uniref:Uncharacterized protein n=1 Tax=Periplaneta americana TaxID=6978 RepID=A0ABQ8SC09_PERAM|nr:hypothetical protein ANN_20001 [Periplaneta americana]